MQNSNTIIIFLSCIVAIIIFGKALIWPLKNIIKLVVNSILGGVLIAIVNYIGVAFSFHIGLNVVTAIFVRNTWNSRSSIACHNKNIFRINKSRGRCPHRPENTK